jgi:multicomponent Na+:H+ antiporter subunit D
VIELIIGLVPFLPALAGFALPAIYLTTRSRLAIMTYMNVALAATLALSTLVALEAYRVDHPLIFKAGGWPAPIGIVYVVDKFMALLGFVSAAIYLVIGLYSVSYIVDEGYPWYAVLLLGNACGVLGVIYTGDLFNLFVMLEVTSVSSYALVMYYRHRADSVFSALKYAFIGSLGTTLYLLAMGLVYAYYGTLNLVDFSYRVNEVHGAPAQYAFGAIMVLALWAFAIKSGVFPNHFWLPDAHPAAPTPISALLSGLVVNTGVVGLYKVLHIATWNLESGVLASIRSTVAIASIVMGSISAIVGALLMFIQTDVKRLIAYSTVMNLGYLFMSVGCLSPTGLQATIYYVITHSLAKATLFLSAGVFIKIAGSRDLNKLWGLGSKEPVAGIALAISTLTLAGVPPLPGFLAKLLLYEALFEVNPALAILMVVASAIGLLSYMRLFYTVILEAPTIQPKKIDFKLAKVTLTLMTIVLVVTGVIFLFVPQVLEAVVVEATKQASVNVREYVEYVYRTLVRP